MKSGNMEFAIIQNMKKKERVWHAKFLSNVKKDGLGGQRNRNINIFDL